MLSRLPNSSGWGPGKNARSRASLSNIDGKQHDSTEVMDAAASKMPACVLQENGTCKRVEIRTIFTGAVV
jgi:hypothetical protein